MAAGGEAGKFWSWESQFLAGNSWGSASKESDFYKLSQLSRISQGNGLAMSLVRGPCAGS